MKLGFATRTPLGGMPYRTMQVCNSILEKEGGWAKAFIDIDRYGERTFPKDHGLDDPDLLDCDVLVVSSYMNPDSYPGMNVSTHYSTEPHRWRNKAPSELDSTVVAQYQYRFAKNLSALPNCIPIDDPLYVPALEKGTDDGKKILVYCPTSRSSNGWANKGYAETVKALRSIERDFADWVQIYILENRPHEEVMAAKRRAHIVIDECATGSYHSSALEGLSCGAATLCWIDNETREALHKILPEEAMRTLPFELSTISKIEKSLENLILNESYCEIRGSESRKWMKEWYSEKFQAEMWIQWHRRFWLRQSA